MEPLETSSPGRRTSSSLTACVQCQGVFPVMDMRAHDRQMYCRTCHRKVGGVDLVHGPPPPLPVADGDDSPRPPRPPPPDTEAEMFAAYAALRTRLEERPDDLEGQKEAASLAARLGLDLESVEHYRHAVHLDPDDDDLVTRLGNVELNLRRTGQIVEQRAAVDETRVPEEAVPFWRELPQVITYPFQGRGPSLLLVAGLFFGGMTVIAQVNVIGWVIMACVTGYVGAYLFEVINSSAAGQTKPPDFPEPTSALESYVFPLFALLGCGLVAYLPVALAGWAATNGWLPMWLATIVILGGLVFGTFVYPMTLMVKALFQDFMEVLNPKLLFGSMARILPDYIVAFVTICVIWVAYAAASGLVFLLLTLTIGRPTADALLEMDGPRVVSWVAHTVVTWPLLLYCILLQGHLLGRLYRQGLRRLAWFVPPTADTLKASRMSAGILAAGFGAAVLFCGAIWGVFQVATGGFSVDPVALVRGESCPLGPETKLTYYWTHTDGPRGLSVYTFRPAPDGNLEVVVTTEVLAELNEGISSQTVGILDTGSGDMLTTERVWLRDGVMQQQKGAHIHLYGPRTATKGDTYVNDWTVRDTTTFRDTWDAWKVHDRVTTSSLFYDRGTGIFVGRKLVGVGFTVEEYLVEAEGVPGLADGPPAGNLFELLSGDDE